MKLDYHKCSYCNKQKHNIRTCDKYDQFIGRSQLKWAIKRKTQIETMLKMTEEGE